MRELQAQIPETMVYLLSRVELPDNPGGCLTFTPPECEEGYFWALCGPPAIYQRPDGNGEAVYTWTMVPDVKTVLPSPALPGLTSC